MPPIHVGAGVALIIVVALLAYLPSINGGFVWDDDLLLTNNQLIKSPDGLYRFWCSTEAKDYWPATNTTFWIEWRLWEMNPAGYHVSNLILHIVEALLIWIILRKLSIPGAFLAAIIFVVHPVNVESVAWIAQRKNTMAMLFFLLSILCYLNDFKTSRRVKAHSSRHTPCADTAHGVCGLLMERWYWLSLAAFILAMLSKGSVAILPVLLLGIIWWLRPLTRWDFVRTIPFFLVAMVLSGVNVWFQTHGTGEVIRIASFAQRLLGAGGAVWFYLYEALLPVDLAPIYPQWNIQAGNLLWWLPLLAAIVVTLVLWRYRKGRGRPLVLAWGIFCVALAPVMGFTDVLFMRYSLVADRYQHIAIISVIALVAAGWSRWHQQVRYGEHWKAKIVAAVAIVALAFLSWQQNGHYSDEISLYQATLEKTPNSWIAHYTLGFALVRTHEFQEAKDQFETALRLNPEFPEAHNNLGAMLAKTGLTPEAIEHFQQAIHLRPSYVEAHYNLASTFLKTGQLQEAIEHFQQVIRYAPDNVEAQYNLGNSLVQTGKLQEAIEHYKQVLRLKPDFTEAHYNLGITLVNIGRRQDAIEQFEYALAFKPDYPEAHYHLGDELLQLGRLQEAIEHYQQALKLKPDYPEAHSNLGSALFQAGRSQEAIEHYEQALRQKPGFTIVYSNLALAYAGMHQSSEAISTAQKGIELARSQGQTAMAKHIEDWLNSYRAGLSKLPNTSLPAKAVVPKP